MCRRVDTVRPISTDLIRKSVKTRPNLPTHSLSRTEVIDLCDKYSQQSGWQVHEARASSSYQVGVDGRYSCIDGRRTNDPVITHAQVFTSMLCSIYHCQCASSITRAVSIGWASVSKNVWKS